MSKEHTTLTYSYKEAAEPLIKGGVGIIPTDTLYGTVARASDKHAVARMYKLKQREHKPGTIIAANIQQLIDLGVDEHHLRQAQRWWPGSLSVETPLGSDLSYLHQDTGRQGVRIVADEALRQLLEQTGPLVTSSANQPGEPPATTVEEAHRYFGDSVDFYVDGGNRAGAQPSTIVRITEGGLELIRQGVVRIPAEVLTKSTTSKEGCPYCLGNGMLKTPIIYEDDDVYVTQPLNVDKMETITYIIVPKRHTETLESLPDNWWHAVKEANKHLPTQYESFNFSLNFGKPAGQTLKHLHFWVIQRQSDRPSEGKGLAALLTEADSSVAN